MWLSGAACGDSALTGASAEEDSSLEKHLGGGAASSDLLQPALSKPVLPIGQVIDAAVASTAGDAGTDGAVPQLAATQPLWGQTGTRLV